MTELSFKAGALSTAEQAVITEGFARHTELTSAPPFKKAQFNWLAHNEDQLIGALTAELLWDWLYIDELWVDEALRGKGLGRQLMLKAEDYTRGQRWTGIWLWTQSWQASGFYEHLGYSEFARFPNFPRGYDRIGYRKHLTVD